MENPRDLPPAAESIQGANPFVGMTRRHMAQAAARWAGAASRNPLVATSEMLKWAGEEVKVLAGVSDVEPDSKDRRFADSAWSNPLWKRLGQAYLVSGRSLLDSTDRFGLDDKSAARARFALTQVVEAAAPTNNFWTNPAAMKRAVRTRGQSLLDGGRHFVHDAVRNGGMPSQVDTRPFKVGETLAVTPGEVVHRSPLFELIQYQPSTSTVMSRPTVVIPPQINRFYFLDLAPGRSFAEYALSRGIQVFMISWRNPTREQRDWGLDDYVLACAEALEVASERLS